MPQPDADAAAAQRPLVLIVDDMSIIREPISVCLRNAGYDTALAADEPEALRLIQSRAPDLLVLDIHLGKGDGLSLLALLRAKPKFAKLPVILLTVETTAPFVVRASKLGVRDYLLKSRFSLEDLLTRVRKLLTASASQAAAPAPAAPQPSATAGGAAVQTPETPVLTRQQTIEKAERALNGRTLSGSLAQVISMAAAPETSMNDLGALIARDAMLTANVLRVANSAAYSSVKSIVTTIPDAIRKIGCAAVGQIAAAIAVIDCLPDCADQTFNLIRAWQHSFAVAQLSSRLSPSTDRGGGVAYLVGLCHDLTDILFHSHFPAQAAYIDQNLQQGSRERGEIERATLGMTQAQLTPIVLDKIGLPETIREPIVEFHNAVYQRIIPAGALACRLWMAEMYANGLLLASSPASVVAPLTPLMCKRAAVEKRPACPDAVLLRAEVFSLTSMLARLSPKQDASLSEPLFARGGARIWFARDPAFSLYDPLAAALDSIARVQVQDRLPTAGEAADINGIVVATAAATGCRQISQADIRAAAAQPQLPLLWLAPSDAAARITGAGTFNPVHLPISLAELQSFIDRTQGVAARPAA